VVAQGREVKASSRRRRPDRLAALAALSVVIAGSGLLVGTGGSLAAASSSKGSSGSFTFSGSVSGTLKVPAFFAPGSALAGCSTVNGTDTITWRNVKLDVDNTTQKLANVLLAINAKFGHTQTMGPSTTSPSTSVTFSTTYAYSWQGASGTATTTSGGKSGSLKGTLMGTDGRAGTVTIAGSWAGCTKPASV
jgi:hypothetical protein